MTPGDYARLPNEDFLAAIKDPDFADAPPQTRKIVGRRLIRMYGGPMTVANEVEKMIEHSSWRPSE